MLSFVEKYKDKCQRAAIQTVDISGYTKKTSFVQLVRSQI